ncbi:MAG: aminotransferase class I/II-fold pyridoxal phosphate-dependent enzyme, partial [Solirubrobacterales bacterium]|nr:aminotransferase class I/II-fold pyridoxal phosphate-dependent enzyme [Solirubrobacterales bacterium]
MLAAITENTQLVLLCNPNNPTGTYIPFPEVAAFVARVPEDVTILIDEAYIEFQVHDQPNSSLSLLSEYENVVLLRSFSKSHSLAGLRVGYSMGSPAFRAAVDAVRQPFSVNALAQAAATEALRHDETIQTQIRTAIAERIRVEEGFAAIGLDSADTQANFSGPPRCERCGDRRP